MLYGYARVSKKDQDEGRQVESLLGRFPGMKPENLFTDKASSRGKKGADSFARPEYMRMKSLLKPGDEVAVHELSRFGRSRKDVIEEIRWYGENGIRLRILDIPTTLVDLDENDWVGEMVNNIVIEVYSTLAEQEREAISKRTREALKVAAEKGVRIGRPVAYEKFIFAHELCKKGYSVTKSVSTAGLSRGTYYKYLRLQEEE